MKKMLTDHDIQRLLTEFSKAHAKKENVKKVEKDVKISKREIQIIKGEITLMKKEIQFVKRRNEDLNQRVASLETKFLQIINDNTQFKDDFVTEVRMTRDAVDIEMGYREMVKKSLDRIAVLEADYLRRKGFQS